MKRYNLLNEDDLIKGRHYEVVSTIGQNPNPKEIVLGGSYDDGKFNDERCRTSYVDCEEKYPVFKQRDASEMEL